MSVNVMKEQAQEKKFLEKKVPGLTLGHLRTRLVEWGVDYLLIPSFWDSFLRAVQQRLPVEERFSRMNGLEIITSEFQLKAIIIQLNSKNSLIFRIEKNIRELWLGNIG
ncbi:MAG: hypothetical protein NUV83_03415 [Candidatus Wolfebacteria bacterium]|nr:hypothetical protein [Candidatus Wolfebacteria bacterium]